MSDMELRTGRFTEIVFPDYAKTDRARLAYAEGLVNQIAEEVEYEDETDPMSSLEYFYLPGVMVINGTWYRLIEDHRHEPYGDCIITENDDGTYSYMAYWYNGGASFEEVIEDQMRRNGILG